MLPGPTARVAVFGGSFDPPHVGHVLAVAHALATAPIDHVLVVPCFQHPFAKDLAPFAARLRMTELAFGDLRRVSVSRVEEELGGESRTLRTLEHLAGTHPGWQLRLLVGTDILADAPKWHAFDRITAIAPLCVVGRRGAGDDGSVLPEVSSTDVRAKVRAGAWEALQPLVPAAVLDVVRAEGLYR